MLFIVGGTTYEEARSVALYNAANPGVRFFLGGSVVLNSKRYIHCNSSHLHRVGYVASVFADLILCNNSELIFNIWFHRQIADFLMT